MESHVASVAGAPLWGGAQALRPEATARDRVADLLEDLPPQRRLDLDPSLAKLLSDAAPPLEDPVWGALVEGLSRGFLADFRATRRQMRQMVQLLKVQDRSLMESFGQAHQALRQAPFSSYPSLAAGLQHYGINQVPLPLVSRVLFQLFVITLNGRLQLLYQLYLAGRPFPVDATEDQRLAHLQPLEALAYRLVLESEPEAWLRWLDDGRSNRGLGDVFMALNKFYFDPYRVNFRFTHHCNIQCAHCYNFSGPDKKAERIDTQHMERILAELPRAGIRNMNLTGGEPFMYLDTVLKLIRQAREVGVTTISIYTNGFFGNSEDNCRKVLGRLKEAGFMDARGRGGPREEGDHLKVSAGVYHQEFLSFDVVINLIRVYHEVFGRKIKVDYEILETRPELQDEIRRRLQEAGVADLVEIIFRGITPLGRGAQFDPKLKHHAAEDFDLCPYIDEIVFDPDGSVLPCCGMNFGNHGIAIGDIRHDGLPELLTRLENSPILQFIYNNPIGRIFDYLDKTPAPEGYVEICNVCQHALGDMKETEDLKRRLAPLQDHFPFWFTAEGAKVAGRV